MPKFEIRGQRKKILAVALIILAVGSLGVVAIFGEPFVIARLRCGQDPIYHSTGFKEGRTYVTPNNPKYKYFSKNSAFNKYYCTEEQAKAAGYYKDLNAEEGRAALAQQQEASLLSNSPVDFPIYAPTTLPPGISIGAAHFENSSEVRQEIAYNGQGFYGIIYQYRSGTGNEASRFYCKDARNPCSNLGNTANGQTVYSKYTAGANSSQWSIINGATQIVLIIWGPQKDTGFTDENIMQTFDSLQQIN